MPGREAEMTATKTFPIFDCDSHIVEPPEIWDETAVSVGTSLQDSYVARKTHVAPTAPLQT